MKLKCPAFETKRITFNITTQTCVLHDTAQLAWKLFLLTRMQSKIIAPRNKSEEINSSHEYPYLMAISSKMLGIAF